MLLDVGNRWATTWSRTEVHLGDLEKKLLSSKVRKKNSNPGDVRCGLLHYQVELMSITVDVVSIRVLILDFLLNTCCGAPHHTSSIICLARRSFSAVAIESAFAESSGMNSKNLSCMSFLLLM